MQGRQQRMDLTVGAAAFDTHRALATGRKAVVDADGRGDAIFKAQADQAGSGEDDGVVFAGIELGQAGVDVAAQEADFQIRATGQQLSLAAQAGGTDDAALGQLIQVGVGVGNEGIARVFPLADTEQTEAFGEVHRHVLHGVHGDVGFIFQQRGFEFLDEQALAADFRQRRVKQLVTTADHGDESHQQARVSRFKAGFDVFGLPQGECAFAGGDADLARGHGSIRTE
ncbi:hypothetical protein D3C81_808020 [compost metagenome]